MWHNKYVGLPYLANGRTISGLDCWGLVVLVYCEELGIQLPSLATEYVGTDPDNSTIIDLVAQTKDALLKESWEQVTDPKLGDICVFNILGEPVHVGIYIGEQKFLHVREGEYSVIESLDSYKWNRRLEGTYRYVEKSVQLTGAPHPLQTQLVSTEWQIPGNTIQNIAEYISKKYSITIRLMERVVITIDGVPVPRELWTTTTVSKGQVINYRIVAGKEVVRVVVAIAIIYVAIQLGQTYGVQLAQAMVAGGGPPTAAAIATSTAVITAGVQVAGALLINAIAPIPQAKGPNDPGSGTSLSLFNGSSNQANRFGSIPVVLGRVRMAAMLAAQPYIEAKDDTSIINLLLTWGFGPLAISEYQIGLIPINEYYANSTTGSDINVNQQLPVTVYGFPGEDETLLKNMYSRDITQSIQQRELDNPGGTVTTWTTVSLSDKCEKIELSFSFPGGLRKINKTDGNSANSTAKVEIQYKPSASATWITNGYTVPGLTNFTVVEAAFEEDTTATTLFKWCIIAIGTGNVIKVFEGTPTPNKNSDVVAGYRRIPALPKGFEPLYRICIQTNVGIEEVDDLRPLGGRYAGLDLTISNTSTILFKNSVGSFTFNKSIRYSRYTFSISTGNLTGSNSTYSDIETDLLTSQPGKGAALVANPGQNIIYTTLEFNFRDDTRFVPAVTVTNLSGAPLQSWTHTQNFTVAEEGAHRIYFNATFNATISIDGRTVINLNNNVYNGHSGFSETVWLTQGIKSVTITASVPSPGAVAAVRFRIFGYKFTNVTPATALALEWGNSIYQNRKNAFNTSYTIENLPLDYYDVRVRRLDNSNDDRESGWIQYNKVYLYTVTGYSSENTPPTVDPKDCRLAKTAIRLQSTNKVNGNIDGVNALVCTLGYDWTGIAWVADQQINNPASLFRHVLTHPANMYAIAQSDVNTYIDLPALQDWHTFCNTKNLTYNNVLTNVRSVMDVLREICAAGLASPSMVNGKWTVVVDKPRTFITQHFTPHNSWGFESTKILAKLPDAFRVTINNETQAYQPYELLVYNSTKTAATAKIYEELQLPGVTNRAQAEYLGKWHYAQLKLRPEIYTLNVDFEYLVCTRGDLVRVSHDVPLWGTGTGRIKSIVAGTNTTIVLTEELYLETVKSYIIRIRTNSNASLTYNLLPVATSDYYTSVLIAGTLPASIETDNLFMIGELVGGKGIESQELIVLAVEPTNNTSAKLTLVDYSPDIYSEGFTNAVFNPNITITNNPVTLQTITTVPVVISVISDSALAEEISSGIYTNTLLIGISNGDNTTVPIIQKIQLQLVDSTSEFSDTSLNLITIDKSEGGFEVKGLKSLSGYKFRVRYTNAEGTICGPWSDTKFGTVEGKIINTLNTPNIVVTLENHYLVITPQSFTTNNTPNFKTYEYRVYKNAGTGDFWDIVDPTLIKSIQSRGVGRIDLLSFPTPRLSDLGIQYRIACRTIDNNSNISNTSILSSFILKTIFEEPLSGIDTGEE
jgi:hypothetical protein